MPSFCFTNQTLTDSDMSILKGGVAANKKLKNVGTGREQAGPWKAWQMVTRSCCLPQKKSLLGCWAFSLWPRESGNKGHNDEMLFQGLLEAPVETDTENKTRLKRKRQLEK